MWLVQPEDNAYSYFYPPFEDVTDYEEMGKFYETAPLVRINCKIETGGASVSNKELTDSMGRHKAFLLEQIQLYQANIILCCGFQGEENMIVDFIKENLYKDLKAVPDTDTEGWMQYSKAHHLLVIDAYHPSYWGYKDEDLYDGLARNFTKAVEDLHWEFFPLGE